MESRTLKRLLLAGGLALAIPATLMAQSMPDKGPGCDRPPAMGDGPGMMDGHRGDHLGDHRDGPMGALRGLNLTDTQRDQVFQFMHEQAPQMREKMKVVRQSRDALEEMARTGSYDEAKVKTLTETSAQAMAEMEQVRARNAYRIYQILTPEQRQQFQASMQHRDRRGDDFRPGRPG